MKNKKESVKQNYGFLDTKTKIIGACAAAAVIIILVAVFMFMESNKGKLIVKNNSDLKLEYVKTTFINADNVLNDGVQTKSVDAGKTLTNAIEPVNLLLTNSNLEVKFKFENHDEMVTDVGTFNSNFTGNIKISFAKTDDPNLITLKIKANNGIFQSSEVNCDEEFTINLSEGKILE